MASTVHERAHTRAHVFAPCRRAKFSRCAKSVLPLDRSSLPARSYPSYDENSVGLADELILRRCLARTSVGHARARAPNFARKKNEQVDS